MAVGQSIGMVDSRLRVTGAIDYTRATWRVADWSSASELLTAAWSRATWRCTCSVTTTGTVDPTRATWRRATWRSTDWTK